MSNQSMQDVDVSGEKIKIALAFFSVVAGVVGFYFLSDNSVARVGALFVGLLFFVIFAGISSVGRQFFSFSREAMRETKKVVWPARKEALQITAVVFGFVLVMAIFLWGVDKLLEFLLYDLILGWKK
jgi:preprotein translocase subunit SecE